MTTAPITRTNETVEYGIGLDFTPVVLGPGRISLEIATEVSEPTWEGSVVNANAGTAFPVRPIMSIRRRKASTSVELPSGGSIVIGGLVQDNIRQAMSGLPGVSKIPILGHAVPLEGLHSQRDRACDHRNALSGQAGCAWRPVAAG